MITMKVAQQVDIRQIGNSLGIVIPKPILAQLGLDAKATAEMIVERGSLVLRKVSKPLRKRWAEAAKKIAEAGDDKLVMGEFGNLEDEDSDW